MAEVKVENGTVVVRTYTEYEGPYTVDPHDTNDQTLHTQYTKATDDVTVHMIPVEYAEIARDGDTLFIR